MTARLPALIYAPHDPFMQTPAAQLSRAPARLFGRKGDIMLCTRHRACFEGLSSVVFEPGAGHGAPFLQAFRPSATIFGRVKLPLWIVTARGWACDIPSNRRACRRRLLLAASLPSPGPRARFGLLAFEQPFR